jgi:hypothetical protein
MEFKNGIYEIEDFLNTYHSQIILGYTNLDNSFTDEENELIMQGKIPKRKPIIFKTKNKIITNFLPDITEKEAKRQCDKLKLKQKMQDEISVVQFKEGWQCYNCMENNDIPLDVIKTEKTMTCSTCSEKVKVRLITTPKVLIIKIIKGKNTKK